jgi:LysM repeat protein
MSDNRTASSSVHLTSRGRLLLVLALAAVLFAAFSLGRTASEAADTTAPEPARVQVTVQPGETLWGVAQRIAPDADPRQVVRMIREVNGLDSSALQVGQQLLLPARA